MQRIGVTHGLRGWFAVLYDEAGPILAGIGSYETREGAEKEALDWARSENRPVDFPVYERESKRR